MSAASSGRERWIYGLHALAGGLLALPTLGLIGDWLSGAFEAFFSFLAMMLWFSLGSPLPFLAVGWAALVGYWWWTGDARRRRFLAAWYASAALTLAPFWPLSSINAVTLLLSLVGILLTALVLPPGYWR